MTKQSLHFQNFVRNPGLAGISARTQQLLDDYPKLPQLADWQQKPMSELMSDLAAATTQYRSAAASRQGIWWDINADRASKIPPLPRVGIHPLIAHCVSYEMQINDALCMPQPVDPSTRLCMDTVRADVESGLVPRENVIGAIIMLEKVLEWTVRMGKELRKGKWMEDGRWDLREYGDVKLFLAELEDRFRNGAGGGG